MEIFLLKMGKPIKIDNIARDLIKLSGFEPETDIPITYIGLRPGEKLYEELQHYGEKKIHTEHTKIMILKDGKTIIPFYQLKVLINNLLNTASLLDLNKILLSLKQILPTYEPSIFSNTQKENLKLFSIKGDA